MNGIPDVNEPQRFTEAEFVDSPFVQMSDNEYFVVEMKYVQLGMDNAHKHCLVRKEVYDRLVEAAKKLPEGYKLKIWDAWRPFALQHELYVLYSLDIVKEFELEACTDEQKNAVISKFVSEPIEDREVPPVHTTGGAVDVTIVDANGNDLEMGTEFDAFSDKTYTNYFEGDGTSIVRDNRRMLYQVMTTSGFTNLPSEWWHFDYGDRFWAFYNKRPAMFKGVFTKEEING